VMSLWKRLGEWFGRSSGFSLSDSSPDREETLSFVGWSLLPVVVSLRVRFVSP
jgi:hypothetical protein